MKILTLLPLLCFFSTCIAWIIPDNLEDGIYHVEIPDENDHSSAIIKRRAPDDNPPSRLAKRSSRLAKRQQPESVKDLAEDFWEGGVRGSRGSWWPPHPGPPNRGGDAESVYHGLDIKPAVPHLGVTDNLTPAEYGANELKKLYEIKSWDCHFNERRMNINDYREAKENLFNFCDAWKVNAQTSHISLSKSGTAYAYSCNFDREKPRGCSRAEFLWVEATILDPRCGQFFSGYANARRADKMPNGNLRKYNVAYGRGSGGVRICGPEQGGRGDMNSETWVGMPNTPTKHTMDHTRIADARQANLTQYVSDAYKHRDMARIDDMLEDFFQHIQQGEARQRVKDLWLQRFYLQDEARRFVEDELHIGQTVENTFWTDNEIPDEGRAARRKEMTVELAEIEDQLMAFGVLKTGIPTITDLKNVDGPNLAGYAKDTGS